MFGKNKLVKHSHHESGLTLRVQEIFCSIQGEGPFAGTPAFFIRLGGCNLRCYFCDTDFESDVKEMSVEEIIETIGLTSQNENHTASLIVITGGEPLLQNIAPLCLALFNDNFKHVQIETAGTVWPESMNSVMESHDADRRISIVCSPKTPKIHPTIKAWCNDYKYIIKADEESLDDGLPEWSTQDPLKEQRLFRPEPGSAVWLQPMMEYHSTHTVELGLSGITVGSKKMSVVNEEQTLLNMRRCAELAMRYDYRVSIQLHKLLELP